MQVLSDSGEGADNLNRWMATDRSANSDRFLEPAVRDMLFLDTKGKSFDLAAVNIQVCAFGFHRKCNHSFWQVTSRKIEHSINLVCSFVSEKSHSVLNVLKLFP